MGRQVRVLWPDDQAWYLGTIAEYLPESGRHKVMDSVFFCFLFVLIPVCSMLNVVLFELELFELEGWR